MADSKAPYYLGTGFEIIIVGNVVKKAPEARVNVIPDPDQFRCAARVYLLAILKAWRLHTPVVLTNA